MQSEVQRRAAQKFAAFHQVPEDFPNTDDLHSSQNNQWTMIRRTIVNKNRVTGLLFAGS